MLNVLKRSMAQMVGTFHLFTIGLETAKESCPAAKVQKNSVPKKTHNFFSKRARNVKTCMRKYWKNNFMSLRLLLFHIFEIKTNDWGFN